jgi:threonine dehydrogenase-like Zn-dependent dehydrogenase
MKAVIFEGRNRIAVRALPEPKARPGEVVVGIASSGICETDVWVYRSGAFAKPGMVLGHMAGGTIVEVGPGGRRLADRRSSRDRPPRLLRPVPRLPRRPCDDV